MVDKPQPDNEYENIQEVAVELAMFNALIYTHSEKLLISFYNNLFCRFSTL